jgi:hypothetical protein
MSAKQGDVWLHSSDVQEAALPMPSLLGPTPSWQPVLGHLSLHCLGALLEHQASGDQTPLSKEPDTASPAWPFEDSHCVIVMYRKVVFFFGWNWGFASRKTGLQR